MAIPVPARRHGGAAEIGLMDALVLLQVAARARRDDRAGLQDVAAARGLERIARILLDQQNAGAGGVDRADGAEDILHDHRREPERRLVQAQQPRLRHHGAAEHQHLLLAAAERAGVLRCARAQPRKHGEHLLDQAAHLGALVAKLEAAEFEIFAHGQEREHVAAFRHQRDAEIGALIRGQARNVAAPEPDRCPRAASAHRRPPARWSICRRRWRRSA